MTNKITIQFDTTYKKVGDNLIIDFPNENDEVVIKEVKNI